MTFKQGLKDGIPICLGYFAVSFAFGIFCITNGLTPLVAIITSLTNLTSAGQFAGVKLMIALAPYIEILLTVLLINLRYSLMSIALTQKLDDNVKTYQKLIFGFGVTDEVFAVSVQKEKLSARYMYGLIILPIVGWTLGTAFGCLASEILPSRVLHALGISLYAMFIAIIIPEARKKLSVFLVVLFAAGLGILFYYTPYLKEISIGFQIIISTIVASLFGALVFPIKEEEKKEEGDDDVPSN
ncbi:MAG: AzlC family ABC transporter permease [Acholeplasmatales bacterium]|nr:AzlC family ABC transporter permease [Acholeplasmatales bacterium]